MKKGAFTLVELIVVITILAILATIGFVSFSGYLAGARDTNRVAQLKSMSDALELYSTKKSLPIPDDKVDIKASSKTIAYQGYIGKNVLETIEYTESGLDPKEKQYFSYYLTRNKKHFQLLAFLEEESEDVLAKNTGHPQGAPLQILQKTHATDYSERFPRVTGKKLGILLDSDKNPIQENSVITASGYLDISNVGLNKYSAIINNDGDTISGTGTALATTSYNASCKRIKQIKGSSSDGVYTIDPESDGIGFKVYCDMTTDGGGWTYATMLADTTTKNLFKTLNTNKITSLTDNISSKGQISDIWKDSENKDIMLKCSIASLYHKSYEIPTIIYDYLKSDINNLEKTNKSTTTFSTAPLNASWNGYNINLGTTYGVSGGYPKSHYIMNSGGDHLYCFFDGYILFTQSSNPKNSACYSSSGTQKNQVLDINNYCMTAIR